MFSTVLRASLGKKLDGALERHVFDRISLAQAGVRLPVGDVGAEAAVFEHDLARGVGIGPQLSQGTARSASATAARWLREELLRLSTVTVKSCSSLSSERDSAPFFTYGP